VQARDTLSSVARVVLHYVSVARVVLHYVSVARVVLQCVSVARVVLQCVSATMCMNTRCRPGTPCPVQCC
jgi:hypothetical protein